VCIICSVPIVDYIVLSEGACHSDEQKCVIVFYHTDSYCVSCVNSVCHSAHHSVFHTKSQCVSYCSL